MVFVPGDFRVTTKAWNRQKLLPTGWSVPQGNILATYLAACQKLRISATTGVIEILNRRKCMMSPLPYHVLSGFDKAGKIQYILSWSDFGCEDQLPWGTFRHIISIIAPLMTDEELSAYCETASCLPLMECQHIIGRILRAVPLAEADQSLLEVLAAIPQFELLPRTSKFRAAFRLLDVDHSGCLDISEVHGLLSWLVPEIDSSSYKSARELLRSMDANGDHEIDVHEFLTFMAMAVDGISDENVDKRIQALVEGRLAGRFHYDFSGSYCGTRGVLPLLTALSLDQTFESLDLSGCGIDNDGAELLARLLAPHPAIKEIRLCNNRISAGGIHALAEMLRRNRAIVVLDVKGNMCERGFSCVHHQAADYPDIEALDDLHRLLKENQEQAATASAIALRILQEHLHDLRALFTGLMDGNGHVSLPKLHSAVASVAHGWGLDHDTVKGLLLPEGILTAAHTISKDVSGELMLSRGEFLAALDGRAVGKRVCRTIQLHLAEVKHQFYKRASALGTTCAGEFEDAADGWTPHGVQCTNGVSELSALGTDWFPEDPWTQSIPRTCKSGNPALVLQDRGQDASHDLVPPIRQCVPDGSETDMPQLPERVYVVLEEGAEGQVATSLHVGSLPDPHATDPSTPPMATIAIDIDDLYGLLHEQVQDPAQGWGVLMDDVRSVLEPSIFTQNAGRCSLPNGKVTWPVFVRTVLYILHR